MQVGSAGVPCGDAVVRRSVAVRIVNPRVAPVRPRVGREKDRAGEGHELDRAREDEDVGKGGAAPHERQRDEVHDEGNGEERQKPPGIGAEVTSGRGHDR